MKITDFPNCLFALLARSTAQLFPINRLMSVFFWKKIEMHGTCQPQDAEDSGRNQSREEEEERDNAGHKADKGYALQQHCGL
jgi:hypothetical protein